MERKKLIARLDGHSFNQFVYMLETPPSNADRLYVRFITKFYHSFVILGFIFIFYFLVSLFRNVCPFHELNNSSKCVCDLWNCFEINPTTTTTSATHQKANKYKHFLSKTYNELGVWCKNTIQRLRKSLSYAVVQWLNFMIKCS